MVRAIAPLLVVADIERSIAFYQDVLGLALEGSFTPRGQSTPSWASLRRGPVELMLSSAGVPGSPVAGDTGRAQLYVNVDDVAELGDRARARGHTVTGPTVQPYGMIEVELHDPDGFLIILAASSDEGLAPDDDE
jgi:catechol 2,3-dioxygenase-like lactoylglutathione lyase family enzyme